MSLSALIAPQLPFLRRYARALSGAQTSGDVYVAAMLEALIEDPALFDRDCENRVAIYRAFSRIWNAMPINGKAESHEAGAAERRLAEITPLPRQAFLLTAVEGFTPDQAAQVLECSPAELSSLIETAGREIGEQVATDVLIIEDEPVIAMDLENLVQGLGHKVAGNARTRAEAVEMALRLRPGLVLADIHLADGSSGLDAVHDILGAFSAPVIFITAYPESLLTGERPEPTFLIAKPFEEDMVRAVVSQALFFDAKAARRAATAA
ncbi:Response regulator receiver domain-containing protein [Rhodoblastus acidophilus]|uniref:Response regulator receiver domain-containing protein n=1 Tax=Rhodoblastus acidophilus TaxID=1074 RepID=A0A212RSX9_RHOAC|nr:response regulator [Rhodoblastus acidophilus]PPQ40792.1 response regulator [Rhodoblastus acidophilus]RAI21950.1 response regulator [Rhodoblastus acidophilus]SNB75638.1 Response regulator receiver domain-containing protein [Rhodoblastus acidophilus]